MNNLFNYLVGILLLVGLAGLTPSAYGQQTGSKETAANMDEKVVKSEKEWKEVLSPEQYHILREKGTEGAFSGKYNRFKEKGIFVCAACDTPLFSSKAKYDSGSGWPSFYEPVANENVKDKTDKSFGMNRTEVLCSRCDGHLGHVFDDGPQPTGLRYCINSVALEFKKEESEKQK